MKKLNKISVKNAPNSYSNYIPFNEIEKELKAIKKIKERIQYKVFGQTPEKAVIDGSQLIIDDAKSLENFIKTELQSNIEKPMQVSHLSLFLLCCKDSVGLEGIEYLIKQGAEINRTSILGDNALMLIVQNQVMSEENKIKAAQMLIDKGIDINFPNVTLHTPLLVAFLRTF